MRGILYGGCHGLEIEGPGLRFRHPLAPGHRLRIRRATAALEAVLPRFPGARLEPKGLALAVHYRGVTPSRRTALHRWIKRVAAQAALTILPGKKVWDLVPPGHGGKARALRLIRDRMKKRMRGRSLLTVYVGDDATDAEAFRWLGGQGLGVQVGGARGPADYRLPGVGEVHALLRWIAERVASSLASSTRSSAVSSRP